MQPSSRSESSLPDCSDARPKAPPRPVATYIAFVVAAIGALYTEYATADDPEMIGASFLLFGPVMAIGLGIDWLRLQRPGAAQVAWALILSAASVEIVVYGLINDWLPTVLMTAALAVGLVTLRWGLAGIPGREMQGKFIGRQDGRWLFVDGEQCCALQSRAPVDVVVGRDYAFVAKLEKSTGEARGPYRHSRRIHGELLDIAASSRVFAERRYERAWAYTCGIVIAIALVSVALVLPNLEI